MLMPDDCYADLQIFYRDVAVSRDDKIYGCIKHLKIILLIKIGYIMQQNRQKFSINKVTWLCYTVIYLMLLIAMMMHHDLDRQNLFAELVGVIINMMFLPVILSPAMGATFIYALGIKKTHLKNILLAWIFSFLVIPVTATCFIMIKPFEYMPIYIGMILSSFLPIMLSALGFKTLKYALGAFGFYLIFFCLIYFITITL